MLLRYLFIDMNSYFASAEQHDQPELRGKAIAVAPVMAETSCCIAASYEAKHFGVKTGMGIREARSRCPGIIIVQARPSRYVELHHQIIAAVERVVHVNQVCSIDEMVCKLLGTEREPDRAQHLALDIKTSIRQSLGEALRCSIGLGPNVMLAKVAADMKKPDGLTLIQKPELPARLEPLDLEDMPGIGPRMRKRLNKQGILSMKQLLQLSERELCLLWGSKVLGQRWYHALRGEDLAEIPTRQASVGHSHVLPPQLRNDNDAWAVLQRMLYKAAMRLRHDDLKARSVTIHISYLGQDSWGARRRIDPTGDTPTLLRVMHQLYWKKPAGRLLKVGVVLGDVVKATLIPEHLFQEDRNLLALSKAMDQVNKKFGIQGAYFGGLHKVLQRAPMRIAFNRIPNVELEGLSEKEITPQYSPTPGAWGSPAGGIPG